MSGGPSLSVIVVSRHRPAALARCILSLRQQVGVGLELIVVADSAAVRLVESADIKTIAFDQANISAARNLGLAWAAGEIVAFIDDDAVAEPHWAARLLAVFDRPDVVAATGFVIGRNGFSFQWKAQTVDHEGRDRPLAVADQGVTLPEPGAGRAVKTQGTNAAFRAEVLCGIGGFDPAYRFFLDEADVNLRLAGKGRTAVIADARVHHGYLASARRRADRTPVSLHEIAASTAVLLRRHAEQRLRAGRERLFADQRQRLIRMMVSGRLLPGDVGKLLKTLETGWDDGLQRPLGELPPMMRGDEAFLALGHCAGRGAAFLDGWIWNRRRLVAQARAALAQGKRVHVLCLTPGVLRHSLRFTDEGIWMQRGGVWGRSVRVEKLPLGLSYRERVLKERLAIRNM